MTDGFVDLLTVTESQLASSSICDGLSVVFISAGVPAKTSSMIVLVALSKFETAGLTSSISSGTGISAAGAIGLDLTTFHCSACQ